MAPHLAGRSGRGGGDVVVLCPPGLAALFTAAFSVVSSWKNSVIKPAADSHAALIARAASYLDGLPGGLLARHAQRFKQLFWWLALSLYFVGGLLMLVTRHVVFPQIEDYRTHIEQALSSSLNLPVAIRHIDARWRGFSPYLALHGMQIHDQSGRPALLFDNVETEISWASLLHFDLRFRRLEILAPYLEMRRDQTGRIFIAGLPLDTQTTDRDDAFLEWLLVQRRVIVRDAHIVWHDELRNAPPLALRHFNLQLQNDGRRHRFGLTAEPPAHLAAPLDVRGDFRGRRVNQPATWKGQAYAALDYADLAVWRQWIDYPFDLPQGSGAMRMWLTLEQQQLAGMTADVALQNVQVRINEQLPFLQLQTLTGRLAGGRSARGYQLSAQRLSLQTEDEAGPAVGPTDFQLEWQTADERKPATGDFKAERIDFDVLTRFAAYLPLDEGVRQQLVNYSPRGRLLDVQLSWTGQRAEAPGDGKNKEGALPATDKYSLSAHFEQLGINAWGALPGFSELSGSVSGNEEGGVFRLDSRQAALSLPAVFADPRIELGSLQAQLNWKTRAQAIEVQLQRASFENADAAGELRGSYVYPRDEAGTPGRIDLKGQLSRGQGNAVWRYIPLVVDADVRDWLRTSIVGGLGRNASLRLQGDLRNFPFDDGSGVFEIKGRIEDATLDYATGWPRIHNIMGSLEFVGNRMLIRADSARIAGVRLSEVQAEIEDLSAAEDVLLISGKASGPTNDFLDFIERSPLGESIDHFTEDMRAQGNGLLDLQLQLPLQRMEEVKVQGKYRFAGNRLDVDPDLPTLANVYGQLDFSESDLRARRIRATLLGMPLAFDIETAGNGMVSVNADGQLQLIELRKQISHPMLDHLSGSSHWRGRILARSKQADVLIESSLAGIASSLPEPFNKTTSEALPLRFERKTLTLEAATEGRDEQGAQALSQRSREQWQARPHDRLELSLGQIIKGELIRRQSAALEDGSGSGRAARKMEVLRGAIAVGEPLRLPERGLLLAVTTPQLNVERWRNLLQQPSDVGSATSRQGQGKAAATDETFALDSLSLKTGRLQLFDQSFDDFRLQANRGRDGAWRAEIQSPAVAGEVQKAQREDSPWFIRLRQLHLAQRKKPSATGAVSMSAPAADLHGGQADEDKAQPADLPNLDVAIEQLKLQGRDLGQLKLLANKARDATGQTQAWRAQFDLGNEDGRFSGTSNWLATGGQAPAHTRSELDFTLTALSIEKLLARLGYVDAVKRGTATLAGRLHWSGAPTAIADLDYTSLSGELKVNAENGQFNQLEPGMGRLLGILSLQSLPRRITLDFRDVFSQGFAFDSIRGDLNMRHGLMTTQNLQIKGPAARVLMSGSVSLPKETQALKVRVQPALGESLAVGAMIANPAAGAITWLAQKALRDPLDQAFAFEYAVTGGWADPKVERLSRPASFAADGGTDGAADVAPDSAPVGSEP